MFYIKQFKFKYKIQIYMSKKQDNNSNNPNQQRQKKKASERQHDGDAVPKTPSKKQQQPRQEQVFKSLQPFVIPPKDSILFTATPNANCTYSHDMKVIQTPYSHQNPTFITTQMGDMQQDYLRPITGKIIWQKTPAKSQQSQSASEEQQSNQTSEQNIPQSEEVSNEEQICEEQFESDEENMQKQQQVQKPKHNTQQQRVQKQKQHSKRTNHQRRLLEQITLPEPNNLNSGKKVFCNCKKTKCLKLYCDCFRINQTCDGCNCVGCHNLEEYADERNNAILVLMDRNPDPFSQKIHQDKHLKGCNCKKSFCQKKYCECYQAGLRCGQNCKCDQCKNGGGSQKRERDRLQRQDQDHEKRQLISGI